MIGNLARKIFGTKNDRELKRMGKFVKSINELEESMQALSDDQLKGKTTEFRQRLAAGTILEQLLPEAFAAVREASNRTLKLRHFDVQMLGGITLHEGRIAEMRTGEGKTLVATLPVYLNALPGQGVHVITVNDYLATRDANWMGPVYEALGMTVGVVTAHQPQEEKRVAYNADITYGTNNEFGFDYLRDNMAFTQDDKMQRALHYAIVDEVDSILIDEARTPLIISGVARDSSALYQRINTFISRLKPHEEELEGHYLVDEKQRQVELTELGHQFVEDLLINEKLLQEGESLYSPANLSLLHHIHTALRAHILFHRDVEYIVENNEVVLVDEHTGRKMQGRRLSEGLHQAIEAKEGVRIQAESQTLASTTFQNYFRLYKKLAGMTGTADTEAPEFYQIYGLQVVVVPTNKPTIRQDLNDLVYLTKEEKFSAIVHDVNECIKNNAPVLVGTASVDTSEELSAYLKKEKIAHKVLNAKYHQQEAEIIAQAGQPGAVTVATNMAGRGTDIVLGGNLKAEIAALSDPTEQQVAEVTAAWQIRHDLVLKAGGLHILGSERHESRRIDNQLRGRSGRQGDPGKTRFYLSLDDSLMRIFASEKVKNFMKALGMEKGEAIEHRMVTNAIEKAQRKVEGRNFDIRKQLLEYDDVANDQRQVIYAQRNELMLTDDISEAVSAIREEVVNEAIVGFIPPQSMEEQWDIPGLERHLEVEFAIKLPVQQWLEEDDKLHEETLRDRILSRIVAGYQEKTAVIGPEMRRFEKQIMLQILDNLWKEHLAAMDHLRQGIHLRAYAQKNPKQEYKREAFELFQNLLANLKFEVIRFLSHVEIRSEDEADAVERQRREAQAQEKVQLSHAQASALQDPADQSLAAGQGKRRSQSQAEDDAQDEIAPYVREDRKVGRNEPCPCGSGKKFKQCHGKI